MFITAVVIGLLAQEPLIRRPFLSPIFSDHMVLQRGKANTFWGWTTPGKSVKVKIEKQAGEAIAGTDGKWSVSVQPPKVGGPYVVEITGPEKRTLSDVLVGDVWICGGQSNMQFGLAGTTGGGAAIAAANHPRIRFSIVPTRMSFAEREFTAAPWQVCTPQTVGKDEWNGLSAVGYYFGRELEKELNVPIGLVHDNRGGSAAESWISGPTLERANEFPEARKSIEEAIKNGHAAYRANLERWIGNSDPGSKDLAWAQPDFDDSKWDPATLPASYTDLNFGWHLGVTWFRTTIDLPADAAAGGSLSLGVLGDPDWTFVNGTQVGATTSQYTLRNYAVSESVLKPGRNVIAVRILNNGASDGFASPAKLLNLTLKNGTTFSLAGAKCRVNRGPNLWSGKGDFPWSLEGNYGTPSVHYNAMIAPVAPLAVKGAIWYQGESNVGRSRNYIELMQQVASDWRKAFRNEDFPFLQVQLASYLAPASEPGDSSWAALREAQMIAAGRIPRGGLVTAIDIGEANDIHPRNKLDVGVRLAKVALNRVYGKRNVVASGPTYRSFKVAGNSVRIQFDGVDGGLTTRGSVLTGFSLAGQDKKFHWAKAQIVGNEIVLTSSEVPLPVAARFAWADNPEITLFNGAGWPAFPFRTDNWPVY